MFILQALRQSWTLQFKALASVWDKLSASMSWQTLATRDLWKPLLEKELTAAGWGGFEFVAGGSGSVHKSARQQTNETLEIRQDFREFADCCFTLQHFRAQQLLEVTCCAFVSKSCLEVYAWSAMLRQSKKSWIPLAVNHVFADEEHPTLWRLAHAAELAASAH